MKYVSFEIAKKLKELGFNERCKAVWYNDSGTHETTLKYLHPEWFLDPKNDGFKNVQLKEYNGAHWEYIGAPTQEEVLSWLRNTHKLHIYAFHTELWYGTEWCYEVEKMDEGWTYSKHHGMEYEECIEEAIKYTLENFVKDEPKE